MWRKRVGMGCLLLAALPAAESAGTVLTFNQTVPPAGDSVEINQDYGDRVFSGMNAVGLYGTAGGDTPNILVSYEGDASNDPDYWTEGYGDLEHPIAFQEGENRFDIVLTADPGFLVTLHSFKLAGYAGTGAGLDSLRILSSTGVPLLSQDAVFPPAGGHLSYPVTPLTDIALTIRQLKTGGDINLIGIDDIEFSQRVIPEPAAFPLLATAPLAGLLARQRRRTADRTRHGG
jgi:hypothetical protein